MTQSEAEDVIEVIEKHYQDELSDWEMQFIESIKRQREDGRFLTEKQLGVIDRMFEKLSNGGRG